MDSREETVEQDYPLCTDWRLCGVVLCHLLRTVVNKRLQIIFHYALTMNWVSELIESKKTPSAAYVLICRGRWTRFSPDLIWFNCCGDKEIGTCVFSRAIKKSFSRGKRGFTLQLNRPDQHLIILSYTRHNELIRGFSVFHMTNKDFGATLRGPERKSFPNILSENCDNCVYSGGLWFQCFFKYTRSYIWNRIIWEIYHFGQG